MTVNFICKYAHVHNSCLVANLDIVDDVVFYDAIVALVFDNDVAVINAVFMFDVVALITIVFRTETASGVSAVVMLIVMLVVILVVVMLVVMCVVILVEMSVRAQFVMVVMMVV